MKKIKKAFTLAEVLITLTIIGVVAAIATPALNNAVQKNKVGPTLRKFVSTIENANEHILSDTDVDTIAEVGDINTYAKILLRYANGEIVKNEIRSLNETISGSYKGGALTNDYSGVAVTYIDSIPGFEEGYSLDTYPHLFKFKDGSSMIFDTAKLAEDSEHPISENSSYKGRAGYLLYDINGYEAGPNRLGKDIFYFVMDQNGSVLPYGGDIYSRAYSDVETTLWKEDDTKCDATTVKDGLACTGSIADNGWKVIYKY